MPTSHPRVGLLLDEEMQHALETVRRRAGDDATQASLVRRAVFEGVALEAVMNEATSGSATQERAARVVAELRELVGDLALPTSVVTSVTTDLSRALEGSDVQERRRRQRALLASPNPDGAMALAITEAFDEVETD